MSKRKKILVVIDPTTDAQPALSRAAEFARHIDAKLALFCCIFNADFAHAEWVTGDKLDNLRAEALEEQFGKMDTLAAPLRESGLRVSLKVAWDKPLHEAIVREAMATAADFVFKDTHHHSALSRAFLTNTDWHLIRECPVPLWLVKPEAPSSGAPVMAAVDPTNEHDQTAELDQRIIDTAALIADKSATPLHLLHVFEPPPPLISGTFPVAVPTAGGSAEELVATAKQAHADALASLATASGILEDHVHMHEGDQVELLPAVAGELKAGVVVMGAVARSALQRAIVGHTAELTLEAFDCDVVIVKSAGFESPVAALPPIYGYSVKTEQA